MCTLSLLCCSLYMSFVIRHAQCRIAARDEEFSLIKYYELIHIDIEQSDGDGNLTLRFTAFGGHYKIELSPNEQLIHANIRHSNVDPHKHGAAEITGLTEPCHFYGHALMVDADKEQEEMVSNTVAFSICRRQGIRAQLFLSNDTLFVHPAAYYLDHDKDRLCNHSVHDEHIIYRQSDFDPDFHPAASNRFVSRSTAIEVEPQKRRLLYNGGTSTVELLMISDPAKTADYQSNYGSLWYEQMFNEFTYAANTITYQYSSGGWSSSIGSIKVVLVEIEVIFSFSGQYASLMPTFYGSCATHTSSACNIYDTLQGGKVQSWLYQYKDVSTFDHAAYLSNYRFTTSAVGWAPTGAVCKGHISESVVSANRRIGSVALTIVHELGHTFGAAHDGDGNSCASNAGLMGTGTGWSSCSVSSIAQYFASNGGLTCLSNSPRGYTSNYGTDDSVNVVNPTPTQRPTSRPTTPSTSTPTGWTCVGVRNSLITALNGYWSYSSDYSSKPAYHKDGYYLFYLTAYAKYIVSTALGSTAAIAFCSASTIESCSSGAWYAAQNGQWVANTAAATYSCSSGAAQVCSNFACIGISGMMDTKDGITNNGGWTPAGCHNEQSYYTLDNTGSKYLCYHSEYKRWIIANELCGPSVESIYAYSSTASEDLLASQNNWMIAGSAGWSADQQVMVSDCGGSGTAIDDGSCFGDDEYAERLCISTSSLSGSALWSGDGIFALYTNQCQNGQPIYSYTISSKVDGQDVLGNDAQDTVEKVYYLHYYEFATFSDSNESTPKWLISADAPHVNALASCEQDDVLECTHNEWKVQTMAVFERSNSTDGVIKEMVDAFMTVHRGPCAVAENSNGQDHKALFVYIGFALVLVFIICIAIVAYCWYRKRSVFDKEIGTGNALKARYTPKMVRLDDDDQEKEQLSPRIIEVEVSIEDVTAGVTTLSTGDTTVTQ